MGFFSKLWSGVKKVAGVAMVGAGTVLSLISPAAGNAVVTVGQAIGGTLIKAAGKSVDQVTGYVEKTQEKLKVLREPVPVVSAKVKTEPAVRYNTLIIVAAVILFLILVFRKKR